MIEDPTLNDDFQFAIPLIPPHPNGSLTPPESNNVFDISNKVLGNDFTFPMSQVRVDILLG